MDLAQEFVVPLSVAEAWAVLTDLERVAPCLPGAQLEEVAGEEYRGRVKVKVGPITAEYRGAATFLERDEASRTAVLRAEGRETRGQGNAAATVHATLTAESPGKTKVSVATTLDISGRLAQFGRGALADVSAKLLGQFVDNLERDLALGVDRQTATDAEPEPKRSAASSPAEAVSGETAVRHIESAPAEPLRVFGLLGPTLLKRLSPLALVGALVALLRLRSRRRRSR